jgi:Flp pilus assembly protein TadG
MKIIGNNNGAIAIIVGLSLAILLGFGALAVDLGFVYMKKVELQTTADAAALAGAGALVSYSTDLEKVKEKIYQIIEKNFAVQNDPSRGVEGITKITYYKSGVENSVDPNQVEVEISRSEAGNNPVTLFLARIFGYSQVGFSATARAETYPVGGSKCLKPFAVPAKFDWVDKNGNKECDLFPEKDRETDSITNVQGYSKDDIGTPFIIKFGNDNNNLVPGQYNPIDFPPLNKGNPVSGADAYAENIIGCDGSNNSYLVEPEDLVVTEPGAKMGPTKKSIEELIAKDPDAYWVGNIGGHIEGSSFPDPLGSSRVGIIVIYDPTASPTPGRPDPLLVLELVGFFIESIDNKGNVNGRLMGAMAAKPGGSGVGNNLIYAIRLIKDSTRGA